MRAVDFARGALVVGCLLAAGCTEALDDRTGSVTTPRVLAVRSVPAEAAPNQTVRIEVLVAGPSGALAPAPVRSSFCTEPRPLAELGAVAPSCLDASADTHVWIGDGSGVEARIPREACQRFGPNPMPAAPGEPSGRPVDPDVTGGYHQPVVAFRTDTDTAGPSVGTVRIACGLSSAPADVVSQFNQRYRRNENPTLESVRLVRGADVLVLAADAPGSSTVVAPSTEYALEVSWPPCPDSTTCGDGLCGADETRTACPSDCTSPSGCGGAETYVSYEPERLALGTRREAMRVALATTAGVLDEPRVGRSGDDPLTSVSTVYTSPPSGEAVLYVVVRDERGGVGYAAHRLVVSP